MTPQCGDLLFIKGKGWASDEIDKLSPEIEKGFSHVALVVSGPPAPLLIEAVFPRVRTRLVCDAVKNVERLALARPLFLAGREKLLLGAAYQYENRLYGLSKYPGLLLDALCRSDWFAPMLSPLRSHPVCSQLVGLSYAALIYSFGESPWGLSPDECAWWCQSHTKDWTYHVLSP
jgi:hypothetical protein